jgi:hypothetical protein
MANFFMSSKDVGEDLDDNAEPENAAIAKSLLDQYAFLYENPDTRLTDEIYRSAFMLEVFATAHLGSIAGFINVPELDTCSLVSKDMESVVAACAASVSPLYKLGHHLVTVDFS